MLTIADHLIPTDNYTGLLTATHCDVCGDRAEIRYAKGIVHNGVEWLDGYWSGVRCYEHRLGGPVTYAGQRVQLRCDRPNIGLFSGDLLSPPSGMLAIGVRFGSTPIETRLPFDAPLGDFANAVGELASGLRWTVLDGHPQVRRENISVVARSRHCGFGTFAPGSFYVAGVGYVPKGDVMISPAEEAIRVVKYVRHHHVINNLEPR